MVRNSSVQNGNKLIQPVVTLQKLIRLKVWEAKLKLRLKLQFAAQDARNESPSVSVNICFLSLFDPKRKHTGPTSWESVKHLARICVLEEKLHWR